MRNSSDEQQPNLTDELYLPHDRDAEATILGSLIWSFRRMETCRRFELVDADFLLDGYRAIYRVMAKHQEAHDDEITPVEIWRYLKESGDDLKINQAQIGELTGSGIARGFGDEPFERALRIVKDLARKRQLMRHANKLLTDVQDGERTTEELRQELEKFADGLGSDDFDQPASMHELLRDARRRLNERRTDPPRGVMSGWTQLDDVLGGLRAGHFCVVAARPGVGKSTFALQWVSHRLAPHFRPLIISFEMSAEEITDRLVMLGAQIPGDAFHYGTLSNDQSLRYDASEHQLDRCRVEIRDRLPSTLSAVQHEANAVRQASGLDFLVIDYLQLMGGQKENRVQDLSDITRGLKLLARDLEIPILCLAQLNRAVEGRSTPTPRLSDLRESGSIEQDADQVLFITRDVENKDDITDAQFIVEKNRHGRDGKVRVAFDRRIGSFVK